MSSVPTESIPDCTHCTGCGRCMGGEGAPIGCDLKYTLHTSDCPLLDDLDTCEDCGARLDLDGYDGLCGNCADREGGEA